MMKKNVCIDTLRKWVWCLWAAVLAVGTVSCSDDVDEESLEIYNYLQGKWVTTHLYEKESSGIEYEKDILSIADEDYALFGFDENNMCTLYESGDAEYIEEELPISARYRVDGDRLSCPFFYGDYATYVTVKIISDDEMQLILTENDIDGGGTYTQIMTCKRYNVASIITGLYGFIQGKWVTTHLYEDGEMIPSDGGEPQYYDNDKNITSKDDEDYMVFGFSTDGMCTIYESGDEDNMGMTLPASEAYKLVGDRLFCPFFGGKFADFVTVKQISTDEMELTLVDNGTDAEGTQTYTKKITCERYYK